MSMDLFKASFGFHGMREVSSTATVGATVSFNALQAMEATTVTFTSNGKSEDNQSTFTSLVIPQGGAIFGDFTGVTVASGKLLGYLKQ